MEIRKPLQYHGAVQVDAGGESRTKQSFKKECDINVIMAKYQKTGAITHFNKHQQNYGMADGQTFQEAMNLVCEAQEMFNELPSSIRSRFGNDPAAFLDFVQNEENADEMARMGLIQQSAEQSAVTPAAAEGESSEAAETPA